ncbi:unnamed protein product [Moneuplotes crassus]|uniref:Uncharacterized protein n=1 Tax=Euplotes crassus TaxID=5936 RepID=A0AAD1UGV1_EUPCR|nr:unnamed protein product [Moneuplotes crassus]
MTEMSKVDYFLKTLNTEAKHKRNKSDGVKFVLSGLDFCDKYVGKSRKKMAKRINRKTFMLQTRIKLKNGLFSKVKNQEGSPDNLNKTIPGIISQRMDTPLRENKQNNPSDIFHNKSLQIVSKSRPASIQLAKRLHSSLSKPQSSPSSFLRTSFTQKPVTKLFTNSHCQNSRPGGKIYRRKANGLRRRTGGKAGFRIRVSPGRNFDDFEVSGMKIGGDRYVEERDYGRKKVNRGENGDMILGAIENQVRKQLDRKNRSIVIEKKYKKLSQTIPKDKIHLLPFELSHNDNFSEEKKVIPIRSKKITGFFGSQRFFQAAKNGYHIKVSDNNYNSLKNAIQDSQILKTLQNRQLNPETIFFD